MRYEWHSHKLVRAVVLRFKPSAPPFHTPGFYYRDLAVNGLTGTIPSSIGGITSLRVLGLGDNSLLGTIPRTLSSLTNLTTLGLQNNQLTGTLPAEIGVLTGLLSLCVLFIHR